MTSSHLLDDLNDIAWELGADPKTFTERFLMARESTVSMWCCTHKDWKNNIDNPVCLHCENDRLKTEVDSLKRAIKILQSK